MGAKGSGQFSVAINFRVPGSHATTLQKLAKVRGVKASKVFREAIAFFIEKGMKKVVSVKKTKK